MQPRTKSSRKYVKKWKRDAADRMRANPTPAEAILWKRLRKRGFSTQFHAYGYILDFYHRKARLCVEVDGKIHEQQQAEDAFRTSVLESRGIMVIRFTNEQALTDPQAVVAEIGNVLAGRMVGSVRKKNKAKGVVYETILKPYVPPAPQPQDEELAEIRAKREALRTRGSTSRRLALEAERSKRVVVAKKKVENELKSKEGQRKTKKYRPRKPKL